MSTATNKKLQELLELASAERKELKKLTKELLNEINIIKELQFRSDAKLSDLSSKVDLDLCNLNITSTNASKNSKTKTSVESEKKTKLNIDTYFKFCF